MILPIIGYGDPVLRKISKDISSDYSNLIELISDMYETINKANGIGLAAPQIGLPIRLFIVNTEPFSDNEKLSEEEHIKLKSFKQTFINAKIVAETGQKWSFNEGCLSIPDVREDIFRHENVTIEYLDENFKPHTEIYDGIIARVIQHEYDHIEGILFTDLISSLKKKIIKKKLQNIIEGKASPDYKMKFFRKVK